MATMEPHPFSDSFDGSCRDCGKWADDPIHLPERLRQVGLLIDGAEFIPLDIVRKHMPFATPPGVTVEAVYVKDED